MDRWILLLFALGLVSGERDGRWFNRETRTVTKIVRQKQIVTETTPSSCVVVQTSLPPCRHLRSVPPIQPTQTSRVLETSKMPIKPENQGWKPILQPSDPLPPPKIKQSSISTPPISAPPSNGWGWNIFNFGPKETVITQTLREIHTTKYMDPNTVVTFSVKGCRPSRLPFDLPECEPPRPLSTASPTVPPPESGVIVMAPIQFVPGMAPISAPIPLPVAVQPAPVADTKDETEVEEVKEEGKKEIVQVEKQEKAKE